MPSFTQRRGGQGPTATVHAPANTSPAGQIQPRPFAVVILDPNEGQRIEPGVSIAARVASHPPPNGSPIVKFEFFMDGVKAGETPGVSTLLLSPPTLGSHALMVTATSEDGQAVDSQVVHFTVAAAQPTPQPVPVPVPVPLPTPYYPPTGTPTGTVQQPGSSVSPSLALTVIGGVAAVGLLAWYLSRPATRKNPLRGRRRSRRSRLSSSR